MKTLCNRLFTDESGVILSAELVLILTIAVLGIVTGLASVQQAVVYELTDLGLAFSGLNQSYATPSYFGGRKWCNGSLKSFAAGSSFFDIYDGCTGVNSGATGAGPSAVYGSAEIGSGTNCRDGLSGCSTVAPPAVTPVDDSCKTCAPGTVVVSPTPTLIPAPTPTNAPIPTPR